MSEDRSEPADVEAVYDAYIDASLTGEPEDPAAFFARHPGIDTHGRGRIEALHGVLTGSDRDPDQESMPPFEHIGGYRLLRPIGQGGMGAIYLAEQESLGRLVALKLLRPELSASKSALRRFQREAKVIARLSHPNVVKVHELGEDLGVQFIAMELVPGRTLRQVFQRGRPALDLSLAWMEQCARALQAAHDEGIVHRDVKPANILITPDDRPVLLDFGMAHLAGAEGTRLTQTFAGSPSYAAPEQIESRGAEVDGRTDVYGLGATLYECLTLKLPFDGDSLEEIFQKILREEPVPPRRFDSDLPRDVETVVLKAMAKRRSSRYQTAREFADDLRALREKRRIHANRPGLVTRTRRWARRHPARAAAFATTALAIVAVFGAVAWQAHTARQERRQAAVAELNHARAHVEAYRRHRTRSADLAHRLVILSERVEDSHLSEERFAELDDVSVAVDRARQERQEIFHQTLGFLRHAERIDPDIVGTDLVRAQLYVEKMEEAIVERDFLGAQFFRELARTHDPAGELTRVSLESGRLRLALDPPGATVHLFRDRELHEFGQTSERRFIAVPAGANAPEAPQWLQRGEWALRVVGARGVLQAGDIITEVNGHPVRRTVLLARPCGGVERGARLHGFDCMAAVEELDPESERDFRLGDHEIRCKPRDLPVASVAAVAAAGGLPAKVWRNSRIVDVLLPEGLDLRTTAMPLLASEGNLVGTAPLDEIELEPGSYRLLLCAPGRVETVLAVRVEPGMRLERNARLPMPTEAPAGFVFIPDLTPFWIMEREVTCEEYLRFLTATGHPSDWPRDEQGAPQLPDDHDARWPAIGISFEDAQAYARWKGVGYALPTRHEWTFAAQGETMRQYVFGNIWRPRWAKSCYARPRAQPEPGMRYPIDESVLRVYDMTGSVAEWIDDWFDEGRQLRRLGGSSWGFADPKLFQIWGGFGSGPTKRSHTFGIRLVWHAGQ